MGAGWKRWMARAVASRGTPGRRLPGCMRFCAYRMFVGAPMNARARAVDTRLARPHSEADPLRRALAAHAARGDAIAAAVAAAAMPAGTIPRRRAAQATVAKLRRWLVGDERRRRCRGSARCSGPPRRSRSRGPGGLSRRCRASAPRSCSARGRASRSPLRRAVPARPRHAAEGRALRRPEDVRARRVRARAGRSSRVDEPARWMRQVTNGRDATEDLELECEVVVVGHGRGRCGVRVRARVARARGAPARGGGLPPAKRVHVARVGDVQEALSRPGDDVRDRQRRRSPVWAGRAVGGSTVINSGTCYRAPERVFREWREELGLAAFSSASMAPYYERVEAMLRVAPAKLELTGGVGRVDRARRGGARAVAPSARAQRARLRRARRLLLRLPHGSEALDGRELRPRGAPARRAARHRARTSTSIEVVAGRARGVRGTLGGGAHGVSREGRRGRRGRRGAHDAAPARARAASCGTRCSAGTSRFIRPRR